MRLRNKIGAALAAVISFATLSLAVATTPAYAGTGNQICNSSAECLNAWNGGPFVKSYGYSPSIVNNDFTFVNNINECNGGITTSTCPGHGIAAGQGIGALKFTGSGPWVGRCIGDAYNDQNNASSSLDACPGGANGNGGWGVNVVWVTHNTCAGSDVIIYDIHWNGYIRWPNGTQNGQTVYLNNVGGFCMHVLPPA